MSAVTQETSGARAPKTTTPLEGWRLFLRAHNQVMRQLEAELLAEHDLPLHWYDVLLQLAEAPDRRLRMTELASKVLLSRSGLTRLVDRLEREGLVVRAACATDARVTHAVLTEAGLARLREASPTHLRSIAQHVTGRLDEQEMAQLAALMTKLMPDGAAPTTECGSADC